MNMKNKLNILFWISKHIFFLFVIQMSHSARNMNCTNLPQTDSDLNAELDGRHPQTTLEECPNPPDVLITINLQNFAEEDVLSYELYPWLETNNLDRYTNLVIKIPIPLFSSTLMGTQQIWRMILQCGYCKSLVIGKVYTKHVISQVILNMAQDMAYVNGFRHVTPGFYEWDFSNTGVKRICPCCNRIVNVNTNFIDYDTIYQQCKKCKESKELAQCKLFLSSGCLQPTCNDCFHINYSSKEKGRPLIDVKDLILTLTED